MSSANAFQRQSYNVIVFEMIFLVLLVGGIDYLTGYQVSFFMFYGPPISLPEDGTLVACSVPHDGAVGVYATSLPKHSVPVMAEATD
jgi:hypothetical protein